MTTNHTPAKYKIEVHFNKSRTTSGPNTAAITIFESGARLNGDGDELVYLCTERDRGLALNMPNVRDRPVIRGYDGCGSVIPGENLRGGVAMCPSCQSTISSESLTSTLLVNLTTKKLSVLVTDVFRKLESNADIYIKYHPTDIRSQALNNPSKLDATRMSRG